MNTSTYTRTLRSVECCHVGCGVVFGIDTAYDDRLRETHQWFYCPNGHSQHYTAKSELEKAQELAAWERRQREWVEERNNKLRADLASEKHKVAAERGAKTKLKRRIAHGVCPCCKRTFANVAAHMKSKHPESIDE